MKRKGIWKLIRLGHYRHCAMAQRALSPSCAWHMDIGHASSNTPIYKAQNAHSAMQVCCRVRSHAGAERALYYEYHFVELLRSQTLEWLVASNSSKLKP